MAVAKKIIAKDQPLRPTDMVSDSVVMPCHQGKTCIPQLIDENLLVIALVAKTLLHSEFEWK